MVTGDFRRLLLVLSFVLSAASVEAAENADAANTSKHTTSFQGESKPVWEVGVGGGYSGGLDYPASASRNDRTLFLPYVIYRGKTFRVGSGRVKAVAVEKPRFTLDLSLGASFNAESENNPLREGMPDLDFLFEIGPRLEYRLFDLDVGDKSRSSLSWENYLRAVFSTDFKQLESQGLRFGSRLRYQLSNIAGRDLDFFARVGPVWASEPLQDYFYQVEEEYASNSRSSFEADAGYLGTELFYGLRVRAGRNFRLILGSMLGIYDGAKNRDSPLFESRRTVSYAAVMIWSLRQSRESIQLFDED